MIDFQDINERNRIKSVVAAREIEDIQVLIDNKHFALKSYPTKAVDTDNRQIGFVITRDSVDRDGERILPKAFEQDLDHFLDNPVVLYNHNMREPAVGQVADHKISDEEIQMWIKFAYDENPQAAMLWKLYSAEPPYMRMNSAGFISLEATNDAKMKLPGQKNMTYTRVEMIELSLVNIGANRHANSMIPKDIRTDSTLRKEYERAVEEDPILPVVRAFEPTELKSDNSVHVNIGDADNPIILSVSTTDEPEFKEESMSKEKENNPQDPSETKRVVVIEKDMSLADTLNAIIGDGDDREETLKSIVAETQQDTETINQILDGTLQTQEEAVVKGFAKVLDVDVDVLNKAAGIDDTESTEPDNTEETESVKTKEMAAEADNVKQKYYGYMESMRPAGSFEEIKGKIYSDLDTHLFKNLEGVDRWDYLDYEIVGTYADNVVICVFNREFKAAYQINYTLQDGTVTFGDMTQVQLGFQPV